MVPTTAAAIITAVHVTTAAAIMVLDTTAAVITARLIIAATTATGITDIAITIRMPAASGMAAGTRTALARAGAGRTIMASSSGSAAKPAHSVR